MSKFRFTIKVLAIATFMFEAGIITRVCRAMIALRTRVSISAIGSVIFTVQALLQEFQEPPRRLPTRLRHAW